MTALRHSLTRTGRPHGWLAHPLGVPRALRRDVCDRGSLTLRLKQRHPDFRVVPVTRGQRRPHADEAALLGLHRHALAYVREVRLLGGDTNRVFAHSVLPRASLRGGWNSVSRLGTRPLGEALFSNPRVHRRGLEFKRLDARHALFHAACRASGIAARDAAADGLWARRSLFCLAGRPLLVTEVFLPVG